MYNVFEDRLCSPSRRDVSDIKLQLVVILEVVDVFLLSDVAHN